MVKRHLKRIAMPHSWDVKKKESVFVVRPNPGKHNFKEGLTAANIIRDSLGIAKTLHECKKILYGKECLIDGKAVKEPKTNVGLMDVITFTKIKKNYRVLLNKKGKLVVDEIDQKEAGIKICKIIDKSKVKGGKVQLNLNDSRNILVDKDEYKVGDSVVIEIPKQTIVKHLKLEKGNKIFLTRGSHKGETGEVVSIQDKNIIYKNNDGDTVETKKGYAFVVGTDKPSIKIGE